MPRRPLRRAPLTLAGLALVCGLACDDGGSRELELGPSHEVEPVGRKIRWDASPAERHGISAQDFAGAKGASATAGAPAPDALAAAEQLHWTTPPGWVEQPPAMFRDANFLVAGDPSAECYLSTFGGDAGGLDANINRWRGQLSLPPLGAAEIAELPRVPWLGAEAVLVDFQGRWTGMTGDEQAENRRLVGLLQVQTEHSAFLKMIGPAEVIGGQLEAFRALADSFHAGHEGGHDALAEVALPAAGATAAAVPATAAAAGADVQSTAALSWRAPTGWTRGPPKPMREVTYFSGEGRKVECSATVLDGEGGGLLANLNRWCGQMGAPPLADADLAGLERVQVAGVEGVLVRLERGAGATADANAERLLGVVGRLPGRSVFVKLTGPRDAVDGQRAALLQFCDSLRVLP